LLLACTGAQAQDNTTSLAQQISAAQDPDRLYQLGLSALAARQPQLARQALERVVSARPEFAGAWLDLALATFQSGDGVAAIEHLEYLRSQFSLPPAVAAQIDRWFDQWQTTPQNQPPLQAGQAGQAPPTAATPGAGWAGELQLGLGRDSNVNNGLDRRQIILSLPTGNTLFDLDDAYRPRAGLSTLFGLNLGGPSVKLGAGRISPLLLLRSKQLAHDGDYNTLDLQPGLVYQHPPSSDGGGNWQAHLMAQHYRLGGQPLFNGLRLSAVRNQAWQACQGSASADLEAKAHQRVPSLSGKLLDFGAGLSCRLSAEYGLSLSAKTSLDRAGPTRAGGNSRSTELQLRFDHAISPTQSLQSAWQHLRTTDQAGYSPLLQDNAPRSLQRNTLSLSLRQVIAPAWEARLSLERFVQRSNLALFEQRGSQLLLGLPFVSSKQHPLCRHTPLCRLVSKQGVGLRSAVAWLQRSLLNVMPVTYLDYCGMHNPNTVTWPVF
jgi:hypothetical protein